MNRQPLESGTGLATAASQRTMRMMRMMHAAMRAADASAAENRQPDFLLRDDDQNMKGTKTPLRPSQHARAFRQPGPRRGVCAVKRRAQIGPRCTVFDDVRLAGQNVGAASRDVLRILAFEAIKHRSHPDNAILTTPS